MMGAVDPTYPLYPAVCLLAAILLLLVLLTSFVRQSWNLGVAFLCFWLFFENIAEAVNAIIWSDNYDVKNYIYCDIVSHLELFCFVLIPMSTLIILRRLYLIASLKSVELPSSKTRRWNLVVEWTLGFIIPAIIAGPIYYVLQASRFQVIEGIGCLNAVGSSILTEILIASWPIVLPVLSLIIYYPRVVYTFYRHTKDINHFLHSNKSISRTNYMRVLVLASIDILITLPIGVLKLVLNIIPDLHGPVYPLPFYRGWTYLHTTFWSPVSFSYEEISGEVVSLYVSKWADPALAFAIFALFGLTTEARASYWRAIIAVCGWVGRRPIPPKDDVPVLELMQFGSRQEVPENEFLDAELGMGHSRFEKCTPTSPGFGSPNQIGNIQELHAPAS